MNIRRVGSRQGIALRTEHSEAQLLASESIISNLSAQVEEVKRQFEAGETRKPEECQCPEAPVDFFVERCLRPELKRKRPLWGASLGMRRNKSRVPWARSMILLTVLARRVHLGTSQTTMARLPVHRAPQDPSLLSMAAPPARSAPEGRSLPIPSTTIRCSGIHAVMRRVRSWAPCDELGPDL